MSQVVTIISRAEQFPNEVPSQFFNLVQGTLGVLFHSLHNLSPNKAIDLVLQIEDDEKEEEILEYALPRFHELTKTWNESHETKDQIDIVIQQYDNEFRQNKKLVVFDMDSTLITQEVIELIAAYAGVEKQVKDITDAAMRGELDFNDSLAARVKLLKGIESEKIWEELKLKLNFTPGAIELTKGLKKNGVKLAVLSGGFIPLAEFLKKKLGLDYAFANNLENEIVNGKQVLKGTTVGEIVNGDKKAELLLRIAEENNIDPKHVVAIGDGANDLKMMGVAGWGVAWNAKPKVQQQAQCALNSNSLKDVFYIFGFSDVEIEEFLK